MKINNLAIGVFLIVLVLLTSQFKSSGPAFQSGAPAGRTGSPGDGATCTQCHSGGVTTLFNTITTDIPASGYIPGATYNVTASISHGTFNKFGFQVSPQSITGQQKGTLVNTNPTTSQIIGSGKWITHTGTGTTGTLNAASWVFKWIAPSAGSGSFSFYAAYIAANGDFNGSGDIVYNSSTLVSEDLSVGIKNNIAETKKYNIFPTICQTELNISCLKYGEENINISIRNMEGKILLESNYLNVLEDIKLNINDLSTGNYIITITDASTSISKRIVKI